MKRTTLAPANSRKSKYRKTHPQTLWIMDDPDEAGPEGVVADGVNPTNFPYMWREMPSFDEESVKPFLPVWSPSANEPVWDCKWIGNDYTYAALNYFERKIDLENSLKRKCVFALYEASTAQAFCDRMKRPKYADALVFGIKYKDSSFLCDMGKTKHFFYFDSLRKLEASWVKELKKHKFTYEEQGVNVCPMAAVMQIKWVVKNLIAHPVSGAITAKDLWTKKNNEIAKEKWTDAYFMKKKAEIFFELTLNGKPLPLPKNPSLGKQIVCKQVDLLPDDSNDSSDDEAQYVKLRHEALAVMQNIPGVVQKAVEMSLENACASAVASLMTKGVGPTAKDAKLWAKWIISNPLNHEYLIDQFVQNPKQIPVNVTKKVNLDKWDKKLTSAVKAFWNNQRKRIGHSVQSLHSRGIEVSTHPVIWDCFETPRKQHGKLTSAEVESAWKDSSYKGLDVSNMADFIAKK